VAESKFVEGARVALRYGRHGDARYKEAFVEKVYKTGRFILTGDKTRKQWSPWPDGRTAYQAGEYSYNRPSLIIWDETADAEISVQIERTKRRDRMWKIKREIEHMHFETFTDEVLEAFERGLVLAGVKMGGV